MAASYLIDTSVLRGAPRSALEAVSNVAEVTISPYSVWELLSHLGASQFDRVKGNLMKVRHVRILEAPRPALEKLVCLPTDPVHQHVADNDLAYAMLAALRQSLSLEEFYSLRIRDENGDVRQIEGCVDRLGALLVAEEQRFAALMSDIVAGVRVGALRLGTPADRHEGALAVVDGLWKQLGDRVAAGRPTDGFVRAAYVYAGYLVNRSLELFGTRAADPNDFEDAEICLHLWIGSGTTLVTEDKTLRRVVTESLQTWQQMGGDVGDVVVCGVEGLGS